VRSGGLTQTDKQHTGQQAQPGDAALEQMAYLTGYGYHPKQLDSWETYWQQALEAAVPQLGRWPYNPPEYPNPEPW